MFKRHHPQQPLSPCGVAFDDRNGQIIVADFSASGGLHIQKAIIGERRAVNLFSNDLRTTLSRGNAHTDAAPLALSPDASEETILRAILEKTNGDRSRLVQSFTRTPDSRIIVTQVDASAVDEIVHRTEKSIEEQQPTHISFEENTIRVETRTRAITRLWRAGHVDTPQGTTAILVLTEDDYTVGLWSEHSGLVYETEEDFEPGANSEIRCIHTHDTLAKFITAASLAKLRLPNVTTVVLSAADSYGDSMLSLLNDSVQFDSVHVQPLYLDNSTPLDQPTAFAIGALLDHAAVPPCNLAIGPEARLNQIDTEQQVVTASQTAARFRVALVSFLLPFVAAMALLLTLFGANFLEASRLQAHIDEETAIAQKLAKENADYESSKANFGTFRSLLDYLITLRNRQPATHQLFTDLNQRWPEEPSWYIREINVKGANVEIKGKTKNEQAITSFAKSLEFSNGLFSGILTRNNVANTSVGVAPSVAQPPSSSSVIEFTITSTYAPLALPNKSAVTQPTTVSATNNSQIANPAPGSSVIPVSPSNLPTPSLAQEKNND